MVAELVKGVADGRLIGHRVVVILLAQGIAAVNEILGWTDEQVAAVLDAAVIGGAA